MNLILFEPAEAARALPRSDPRAGHLLEVLRRRPGDEFDAGLVDGPRGKGTLVSVGGSALELSFVWGAEPPPPDPLTLVIGLPRPQTARRILQEAAALGVAALHFVLTEKGERGYAQSTLWRTGEWRRHLILGAEQAFCTRLPEVTHGRRLGDVAGGKMPAGTRIALDNYEAGRGLSGAVQVPPVWIAIGPERGWSAGERDLLRAQGFGMFHLGHRVLRTETACVAAVAIVKAGLGLM
ncbi:MAG: RsmE family RNA methyltransferase [Opitutaceae bacterium]